MGKFRLTFSIEKNVVDLYVKDEPEYFEQSELDCSSEWRLIIENINEDNNFGLIGFYIPNAHTYDFIPNDILKKTIKKKPIHVQKWKFDKSILFIYEIITPENINIKILSNDSLDQTFFAINMEVVEILKWYKTDDELYEEERILSEIERDFYNNQ